MPLTADCPISALLLCLGVTLVAIVVDGGSAVTLSVTAAIALFAYSTFTIFGHIGGVTVGLIDGFQKHQHIGLDVPPLISPDSIGLERRLCGLVAEVGDQWWRRDFQLLLILVTYTVSCWVLPCFEVSRVISCDSLAVSFQLQKLRSPQPFTIGNSDCYADS